MSQLILTLNAGSSSVKFAVFAHAAASLEALASGQVDGIGASGELRAPKCRGERPASMRSTRAMGASIIALRSERRARLAERRRSEHGVVAVGHRVVHGGPDFSAARADRRGHARQAQHGSVPLAPLHQPHNLAGVARRAARLPRRASRSPASTPRSTAPIPGSTTPMRCRATITTRASAATAFTACPTNTSRGRLQQIAPALRAAARRRRPSRQRRLDVRDPRRPERRLDHGLHRARRPADGHPLRPARSRRRALSDGREGHERGARSGPALSRTPGSRACPACRRTCASSRPPTAPRRSEAIDYFVCAHPPRDRRSGGDRSAASMRSCSPAASARTPGAFARRRCRAWNGSASSSTARPTATNAPIISAAKFPRRRCSSCPTDEERMIAEHTVATAGLATRSSATIAPALRHERSPSPAFQRRGKPGTPP